MTNAYHCGPLNRDISARVSGMSLSQKIERGTVVISRWDGADGGHLFRTRAWSGQDPDWTGLTSEELDEAIDRPEVASKSPTIIRLRSLVDRSGLTQSDVAERSAMLPQALSRLLSGDIDPSLSRAGRVLDAIGCKWADLDAITS